MQRNARKRNGKAKKVAKLTPRSRYQFPLTRVPNASPLENPVPHEFDTTLVWYANFVLTQATGSALSYAAVRFYTNSALSPDVATPTNRPAGFTNLATLYGSYRVIAYEYDIQIFTREAFGFSCLVRNTNTDPGTSSGQLAFTGEALSQCKLVAAASAPPQRFRGRHTIAQVTGRPVENDDLLAADVTTHPSDLTFMSIFIQAATETFTTATGANISIQIRQRVRFFNRKVQNDTIVSRKAHEPRILIAGDGNVPPVSISPDHFGSRSVPICQ
jgi:hypothetical protein